MEVGKKHLSLAQHRALAGLGLLDLHDQIDLGKDLFGRFGDPRSCLYVVGIGKSRSGARPRLDQNIMPVRRRFARGVGRQADPELLRLDLSWASDLHGILPMLPPPI